MSQSTRCRGESVIGVSRCAIDEANLMGANLDVGNIDWIEYKEVEEEKSGSESPYTNKRYFTRDPRQPKSPDDAHTTVYAWFSIVPRRKSDKSSDNSIKFES